MGRVVRGVGGRGRERDFGFACVCRGERMKEEGGKG